MINFRLEVFYTTAKEKSFTKAAEKLHISQPAVTKHIKALENHYKTSLFKRVANNIELTPAGELLFNYAQKIVKMYEYLNYDLNYISLKHKPLKIATNSIIGEYLIEKIILNNPSLIWQFEIYKYNNSHILKEIQNEKIEFALIIGDNNQTKNLIANNLGQISYQLYASEKINTSQTQKKVQLFNNSEYFLNNKKVNENIKIGHKLNNYSSIIKILQNKNFVAYIPDILIKNQTKNNKLYALPNTIIKASIHLICKKNKQENSDFEQMSQILENCIKKL